MPASAKDPKTQLPLPGRFGPLRGPTRQPAPAKPHFRSPLAAEPMCTPADTLKAQPRVAVFRNARAVTRLRAAECLPWLSPVQVRRACAVQTGRPPSQSQHRRANASAMQPDIGATTWGCRGCHGPHRQEADSEGLPNSSIKLRPFSRAAQRTDLLFQPRPLGSSSRLQCLVSMPQPALHVKPSALLPVELPLASHPCVSRKLAAIALSLPAAMSSPPSTSCADTWPAVLPPPRPASVRSQQIGGRKLHTPPAAPYATPLSWFLPVPTAARAAPSPSRPECWPASPSCNRPRSLSAVRMPLSTQPLCQRPAPASCPLRHAMQQPALRASAPAPRADFGSAPNPVPRYTSILTPPWKSL
mmetsp:Transcript_117513/g.295475  ORF Transcript_117513/g.295475 Transcript_117513/m.295475 type:complete len:358 (-) Transcript_117513:275-1348(-)